MAPTGWNRAVRWLRHPLRVVLWWTVLFSVASDAIDGLGSLALICAVPLGVGLGEVLGRTRVHLAWLCLGALMALLVQSGILYVLEETGFLAAVSPQAAMMLANGVAWFGLPLIGLMTLRMGGVRHASWRITEMAVVTVLAALPYADHRDGALGRPLWLADSAWWLGTSVEVMLVLIAGGFGLWMFVILVLDARDRRLPRLGWAALPLTLLMGSVLAGLILQPPEAEEQTDSLAEAEDGDGESTGGEDTDGELAARSGEASDEGAEGGDAAGPGGEERDEEAEGGGSEGGERDAEGDAEGDGEAAEGGDEGTEGGDDPSDGGSSDGDESSDGGSAGGDDPSDGGSTGGEDPSDGGSGDGDDPSDAGSSGGDDPSDAGSSGGDDPSDAGSSGGDDPSDAGSSGGEESSDAGAAGGEGDADAGANEGAEDAENGSPPPEGSDGEGTGSEVPPDPEDLQEPDLDEPPPPPPPASSEPPPPIPLAVVLIGDDHEPPGERWYLRSEVREALEGDHFVIDLEAELVPTPVPDEVRTDCPVTPLHAEVTGSVSLLASAEFAFAPVEPCRLAHRDNPQPGRFNDSWAFTAAMPTLGFSEILAKRGKALLPPEPDAAEDAEADAEPPPPRVLPVRPPEHFATLPPELQDVWSEKAAELLVGIDEDIANHPLGPALVTREWVEKAWTVLEVPREDASLAELVLGDSPTGTVMHGAEAVAMVARARGIPARVARGYAPPAEARNGSSLVVYHHDAQAWAEIWVAEVGWVPVSASPQPPFSVVSAPPPDLELARQLVEEARGGWDQPYEPVRLSDLFHLLPQLTLPSRETMLRALTVLLAGLLGLIWARKAWAMSRTRWSAHYVRAAHHTALERLTEVGIRRNIGETSTSFARRMETEVPSLAQLSAWHVAAKMSRHAYAEPPTRADVLNTLHAFTRELQSEVPFWRRALGLLDPTSSFRVR